MNTTTYKKAVHWLHNNLILCNNIIEIDPSVLENARWDWYDEDDNYTEIFQWYITDCSDSDIEFFNEYFPSLLFAYSTMLDCWILAVDHYGTSWDSVPCETNLESRLLKD